jgi:hypothetical protein
MHIQVVACTAGGVLAVVVFGLAYVAVIAEERLHVRNSVAVLIAAAVVWVLVGIAY